MINLKLDEGFKLLEHLREEYENWYNSLEDKTDIANWDEFVQKSVEVNNIHNGTEEDLVFVAEDAISKLEEMN